MYHWYVKGGRQGIKESGRKKVWERESGSGKTSSLLLVTTRRTNTTYQPPLITNIGARIMNKIVSALSISTNNDAAGIDPRSILFA